MRIVAIEPVLVDVPLASPVRGVHGTTSVQRSVLARVTTDEGIEGWGNVDPTPGYSLVSAVDIHDAVARLAPALAGADPFNVNHVLARMDRETTEGFEAKAAIEMALLDLKGRAIGIPLMADESVTGPASLIEIIRREAADIVKVKVMKQGGLLRTRQMIDTAAAAGLRVVIGHGFGLTLSTLAEAAVAATSDAVIPGCEAVGPLKMAGDVVADPLRLGGGVLHLVDAPGLGATIDVEARKCYRIAR